jgi:tetratricopeptide (TPR) repeat protein
MIKPFIILLATSIFVLACNNSVVEEKKDAILPDAEKKLREEIKKFPDSLLLKENLIEYYHTNGNYEQAINETEKALAKDTINKKLWLIKATLLSENEDTAKAIPAWEKLVALDPRPENVLSLGWIYAYTKNPLALVMADALLGAPNAKADRQALFIKGTYFSAIGEKEKAIPFFEKCISLDYTNTLAYREKAICLYDLGQYLEALKILELAVAVQKNYEEAYYWMGRCYEKLNKKSIAIENYQMALALDPTFIEAKDALGKLGVVQ